MSLRNTLLIALAGLVACATEPEPPARVTLDWSAGDLFHVGANYRVGNVKTEIVPSALEAVEDPAFGEHWSNEVFWTYQVVESGLVPSADDELYPFAVQEDGTVVSLAVLRAWVDGSLNDDGEMLESDPVVYLVFREDRDRLAAIVSFTNVDGERVQQAWSSKDLDKSWSALSQSMLTAAPTYLAPFAAGWDDDSKVLENGALLDTVSVGSNTVDVFYDDEFGGGLVMSRYQAGEPWPTATVTDNVTSRLLSESDLRARRAELPFLFPDPPPDFDFRRALAASLDIDKALVLDADTMAGGWDVSVHPKYQPWAGSWFPLRKAEHIFGWRGSSPQTADTISDAAFATFQPLKQELERIGDELRDMPEGSAKTEKTSEYRTKQQAYVDEIVRFYGDVLQGLRGGTITIADGKITKSGTGGWSYDLDELSPYDKYAVHMYLTGQTNPNPFLASGWAALNSWAADQSGDNSWWGYCNGWAAAAILEDEPREPVTVTAGGHSITYDTGDLKALTTALHYSTYSRFYGSRFYKEGDDVTDLTPKAFHQLISFYFREQGVPLIFDTDATAPVWNFPAYAADVDVDETTPSDALGRVNINTATSAELQTLTGIGPALAQRIIDYRLAFGPFQATSDLQKVSGIGPSTFARIEDAVTVSAAQREFSICADVQFTTDGVEASHIDSTSGPQGFSERYCYTLTTDDKGRVSGPGVWRDERKHPDFAWVPYSNPSAAATGGSENPYLAYGTYLSRVVDLRRE